ncbi:MAG: hypothetical protein JST05_04350 [Acidobacteria bacterium]|nr:hypothetical protein [Acidobacteriota bacterium]
MANNRQINLDSKDFLVLLQLAVASSDQMRSYAILAASLAMSPSQVHASVKRLQQAKLLVGDGLKGKVNRDALQDLTIHGAKWIFPPVFGRPTRGIPTGAASPRFASNLIPSKQMEDIWVWPSPEGKVRGISLEPIYPSVIQAVGAQPRLHEALVHFDALRAGKVREREVAERYFKELFQWRS